MVQSVLKNKAANDRVWELGFRVFLRLGVKGLGYLMLEARGWVHMHSGCRNPAPLKRQAFALTPGDPDAYATIVRVKGRSC